MTTNIKVNLYKITFNSKQSKKKKNIQKNRFDTDTAIGYIHAQLESLFIIKEIKVLSVFVLHNT